MILLTKNVSTRGGLAAPIVRLSHYLDRCQARTGLLIPTIVTVYIIGQTLLIKKQQSHHYQIWDCVEVMVELLLVL